MEGKIFSEHGSVRSLYLQIKFSLSADQTHQQVLEGRFVLSSSPFLNQNLVRARITLEVDETLGVEATHRAYKNESDSIWTNIAFG